ncbi:MAG: LamG domain-containing protein [Candidatus Poribacteria bacterium]|nr:LamG domain-containing protein [Candidatus Poribacteria bacterium]
MKSITFVFTLLLFAGFLVFPILVQAIEEGIVAYWDFNEKAGDTAKDVSGNGHDGKLLGDPQWTKDGKFGGALEFDQAEDEVNVPFHKDLNQETFTICAWANVEPGSAGHRAVVSNRDEPPTSGHIFYATPQNTWQFWTGDGVTPWVSVQGPAVKLGEWEHLAGTFADGKQMFYVNGELAGERDSKPNFNSKQEFLIGAGGNERAVHTYLFKGIIDEVRLYDRVLDEDEIAAVMESDSLDVEPSGKLALTWGQLKAK